MSNYEVEPKTAKTLFDLAWYKAAIIKQAKNLKASEEQIKQLTKPIDHAITKVLKERRIH